MSRRRQWKEGLGRVVPGALVALALSAGAAHAKPWAKWAPAPLASDSAYAALDAKPADSLSAEEITWLSVQRDWRAQRSDEDPRSNPSSITSAARSYGRLHVVRSGDAHFAKLAARPFDALSDRERAWLVAESAAQRDARDAAGLGQTRTVVGLGALAVVAGVVAGIWLTASAISHGFEHMFGR